MPHPLRKQASSPQCSPRPLWTTSESADRSSADACFTLAEQASEEAGPAHFVLVQRERLGPSPRDARILLAGIVNGVAAVVFIAVADVAWGPAALIAAGSVAGAQLAARYGRRLSPQALRAVIVVVGIAAIVQLVT